MNRFGSLAVYGAAGLAWLLPRDLAAQNFQFMPLASGAVQTSLLPLQWSVRGWIVGDDFDGNGHADVLVTSSFGVLMFQGTATGWTAGSPFVWAEQQPRLVDIDGDGDRDLAFVPAVFPSPTTVLLFRNTPSGMSYVSLPSAMNGVPVQGVALGDVDGNGVAEMIVAVTVGSVTPSLVIARGAPGLPYTLDMTSMPLGLPLGLWPELFDADGDGDLDVLATNSSSGLRLLRNQGGTFVDATASLPPSRTGHVRLEPADYDGDGRTDVAAVHSVSGDIDMLWGGTSGLTFATAVANVPGLRDLEPADFDGDGDLDIMADHGTGIDMLWNQGNRQFLRANVVVGTTASRGAADVNRDGKADVLYVLQTSDRVVRCRFAARYEAGASAAGIAPVGGILMAAPIAADFNRDGRTDVVLPQLTQFTADRALGGGLFQRSNQPIVNQVSGRPWRTQPADMDRDGDVDIVVRDDQKVAIAYNNGNSTFAWTPLRQSAMAADDDLRLHDVDGDGDLDILHGDNSGAMLIRNLGGGQYATSAAIGGPTLARCIEIADVDGDGDGDAIVTSGSTSVVLANNGAGVFAPNPAFLLQAGNPTSLGAGDFDGDGDMDLAVADTVVRMHRNNGVGVFTETTATDMPPVSLTFTISNLVAADLDADGDLDLAVLGTTSLPLVLLVNDGTGRFSDRSAARVQAFLASGNGFQLRAVDYDDDDDLDLLAATPGTLFALVNHVRQCRTNVAPRLGATADFHVISGPGFGQPGNGLLGVGFAPAAPPLLLFGVTGQLELDPTLLQIVAAFTTSPIGVSSAFVAVPPDPLLFGLEVWFQGALLPTTGIPGFTNAVAEVVVR